ncbi:Na(+)/H(+) antiporter [Trichinella spiralis]|uniref:Na(+)/H(+) antiporter n=1 Tax=Trichinella spiralis TaxID=6334 RepID=A0ABR3KFS1_TRISP
MKEVNVQNVEELNEGEFRCLETSKRVIGQLAVLGAIFGRGGGEREDRFAHEPMPKNVVLDVKRSREGPI